MQVCSSGNLKEL